MNDFLDREQLEKAPLAQKFFLGGFFSLKKLREFRVGILRSKATRSTNCGKTHTSNGDEAKFQGQNFVGSFTKGLPHDETGRVADPEQFKRFRIATHTGDFFSDAQLQLGKVPEASGQINWRGVDLTSDKPIRGWESPTAGLTFEMHGPDSHSVTMPPAPPLGSDQLTFEMAEVYWLALLRDIPFSKFQQGSLPDGSLPNNVQDAIAHLNGLPWLQNNMPTPGQEQRKRKLNNGQLDEQTIFRGATPGDIVGPYLSQFLLIGTPGPEGRAENITEGLISYGAIKIDQKVVPAKKNLDHMTTWNVFLDVQDAARLNGFDQFETVKRFITTPRDLATYVHFDALYEAYLNACLILLGFNAPAAPGIRQLNDLFSDEAKSASASGLGKVDGFALFGGPHILNLVTEVSTRALKAVRYQKFNVHVRLRPEALGGWMEAINQGVAAISGISALQQMYDVLNAEQNGINLLTQVKNHNGQQNVADKNDLRPYLKAPDNAGTQTALLPMAFPEGSPMHPSYGAGHATVAGACVTMLKAFFDTDALLVKRDGRLQIVAQQETGDEAIAYVPMLDDTTQESSLSDNGSSLGDFLTVGGELNKIAANISIGRDMAGVHYYTDYIDSLVMGEKIALGVLLEQSFAYEVYPANVRPSFSLTTFLGRTLQIKDGEITENGQPINWCDL